MFDNYHQMIMRVTMQLTDSALGEIATSDWSSGYSGNHIAVFECKLKSPPSLQMIDHTHNDFVINHRINFENWKLVDIDNWMKGNPYFDKFMTAESFQQSVTEIIGSRENLNIDMSSVQNVVKIKKQQEKTLNWEKLKEPLSNVQMPLIDAKKHQE